MPQRVSDMFLSLRNKHWDYFILNIYIYARATLPMG